MNPQQPHDHRDPRTGPPQGNPPWWAGTSGAPAPATPAPRRRKPVWLAMGALATLIVIGSALGGSGDDAASSGTDSAAIGTPASDPQPLAPAPLDPGDDTPTAAGIGDTVRSGDFEFTVTGVEPGRTSVGEGFLRTEAQGRFVLVRVTVGNVGSDAAMFSDSNQTLIDARGREFETSSGAAVMSLPESDAFLNRINPGNSVDGILLFDVPAGLQPAAVELRESLFSSPATVTLS